jgi:hypothetical protein
MESAAARIASITLAISILPLCAESAPQRQHVSLEFVLPSGITQSSAQHYFFGWPLVLRATSNDELSIYDLRPPLLSTYFVYFDPTNCFDRLLFDYEALKDCLAVPPVETYMEFSVYTKVPGANVSFGPNDAWPGLVILSNHGKGLVLDSDFNRTGPLQQRNLAGLMDWVSFELVDDTGHSNLTGGFNIQRGFFGPIMQVDEAVGEPPGQPGYSGSPLYRIDGGPVLAATAGVSPYDVYDDLLQGGTLELRAFIVSGTAPATFIDLNHDGRINRVDAVIAGYRVISDEIVLKIRVMPDDTGCGRRYLTYLTDLDGNGFTHGCIGGDLGPGQIKRPPN